MGRRGCWLHGPSGRTPSLPMTGSTFSAAGPRINH